jgi:hypothetical protein
VGHEDRAFFATALCVRQDRRFVNLKVEDYFQETGKRSLVRFKEKGGQGKGEKEIPVHHKLEEFLDDYLKV